MAIKNKEVLFGLFDDETQLLSAVADARKTHMDIDDVYTPFPVHGLDPILGLEESRLHIVGFFFGLLGTMTAFFGITWIFTKDWPTIFGGKPYFSFPAFVPIMFELTVLFSAIGMVVTFYTVCGLGPGVKAVTLHDRITDDKFCISFDMTDADESTRANVKAFFSRHGASMVDTKLI